MPASPTRRSHPRARRCSWAGLGLRLDDTLPAPREECVYDLAHAASAAGTRGDVGGHGERGGLSVSRHHRETANLQCRHVVDIVADVADLGKFEVVSRREIAHRRGLVLATSVHVTDAELRGDPVQAGTVLPGYQGVEEPGAPPDRDAHDVRE